jgi:hypothetical protein
VEEHWPLANCYKIGIDITCPSMIFGGRSSMSLLMCGVGARLCHSLWSQLLHALMTQMK